MPTMAGKKLYKYLNANKLQCEIKSENQNISRILRRLLAEEIA